MCFCCNDNRCKYKRWLLVDLITQEVYLYVNVNDCQLDGMHNDFRMLLYRITKLRNQKQWVFKMKVCSLFPLLVNTLQSVSSNH